MGGGDLHQRIQAEVQEIMFLKFPLMKLSDPTLLKMCAPHLPSKVAYMFAEIAEVYPISVGDVKRLLIEAKKPRAGARVFGILMDYLLGVGSKFECYRPMVAEVALARRRARKDFNHVGLRKMHGNRLDDKLHTLSELLIKTMWTEARRHVAGAAVEVAGEDGVWV